MLTRRFVALSTAILALGCTRAGPSGSDPNPSAPTVEVEGPAPSAPSQAQTELDYTLWDCGWSIMVFWDDHLHWAHRDVAMAAMGGGGLFTREDHDVVYGAGQTFEATIRYREYPNGQRDPESFEANAGQSFTYTLDGEQLTLQSPRWADDEPLECKRDCYNQDFIDFMDARYQTHTDADAKVDKMRTLACG